MQKTAKSDKQTPASAAFNGSQNSGKSSSSTALSTSSALIVCRFDSRHISLALQHKPPIKPYQIDCMLESLPSFQTIKYSLRVNAIGETPRGAIYEHHGAADRLLLTAKFFSLYTKETHHRNNVVRGDTKCQKSTVQ
jgi:hypothetical protein